MIEFGTWTPDAPYLGAQLKESLNTVFYGGRHQPFPSVEVATNAVADDVVTAYSTESVNDAIETYVATDTRLYQLSDVNWTDRSKGATDYTSTVSNPIWQFLQQDERVFACNIENPLQYRDIGGGSAFADVTTNPPKCRRIGTVRQFLVAGDIDDPTDGRVKHRVQWAAIDDPLDWPLPGSADAEAKQAGAQDLDLEAGAVQGVVGTEYGVVFQRSAIWRMTYVGSPLVWQFDRVDTTRGAYASNSIVKVGRSIYFLAEDGFYVTDGSGAAQPIGHGVIDRTFIDELDDTQLQLMTGAYDPVTRFITWSYPRDGGYSQLIYNWVENRWTRAETNAKIVFQHRSPGYTLEQLDTFGTIDTIQPSLDSRFWKGGLRLFAAITPDNELGTYTGAPLDAVLETGEFQLNEGGKGFLSGVRPLVTANTTATVTVQVGSRDLQSDLVSFTDARSVHAATGYANFRRTGFFHRVKITIAGDWKDAIGIDVDGRADGWR